MYKRRNTNDDKRECKVQNAKCKVRSAKWEWIATANVDAMPSCL